MPDLFQTCDNDYTSDQEQVQRNIETLKGELQAALQSFIKKDPVEQVANIEEKIQRRGPDCQYEELMALEGISKEESDEEMTWEGEDKVDKARAGKRLVQKRYKY